MEKINADDFYERGKKFAAGEGVKKDLLEAETCFREAAEAGHCEAQFELAMLCLGVAERAKVDEDLELSSSGNDADVDSAEGLGWLEKSAEGGCVRAQVELGLLYRGLADERMPVVAQNDEKAGKWLLRAAEQGSPTAQWALGEMYRSGEGFEKDPMRAVELFTLSAASGEIVAETSLAEMYLSGEGGEVNVKKAVELFIRAKRYGNNGIKVVELFEEGVVPKADFEAFVESLDGYYDSDALKAVAELYEIGESVPKDLKKAFACYQKVADHGPYPGRIYFKIASMYEKGEGVPVDRGEAIKNYNNALRFHCKDAEDALKRLGVWKSDS